LRERVRLQTDIDISPSHFLHRNNNHGANDRQFPIMNLMYTPRGFHLRGIRLITPQWTYLADNDNLYTLLPPNSLEMTVRSLGMHRWVPTRLQEDNEDYDDPEVRLATADLDRRLFESRLEIGEQWRQAAVIRLARYRACPSRQSDAIIIQLRLDNWRRSPNTTTFEALRPSNLP
jgi:hypothetical protein